jgi:hypothetical protein
MGFENLYAIISAANFGLHMLSDNAPGCILLVHLLYATGYVLNARRKR